MNRFRFSVFCIASFAVLCSCAPDREKAPPAHNAASENVPAGTPRVSEKFEDALKNAIENGDDALAAYFAEYVLSVEELEAFVEKNFPLAQTKNDAGNTIDSPTESAREIRYALARRLLRESRWEKAKMFFPEEMQPIFSAYVNAIQRGFNPKLSDAERARGFWDAALIVRADGDALFLAAAGPTYVSGGEWENNPILTLRFSENLASAEERRRAESRDISRFVNDRRFRAAMLAQNAASLLPNNDERTARILCTAGTWLRYRDPRTADSFYKSLVIRCPQTEIGKHCAALRWFPPSLPWEDDCAWDGAAASAREKTEKTSEPEN